MTTFVTRTLTWTPGQAATETVDSTEQKSEAEQRASDFFAKFSELAVEGTQPVYIAAKYSGSRRIANTEESIVKTHNESIGYWGLPPDPKISSEGDVVTRVEDLLKRVVPPSPEDMAEVERVLTDWARGSPSSTSIPTVVQSVRLHDPTWYKERFLNGKKTVPEARGLIEFAGKSYLERLTWKNRSSEDLKRDCFGPDRVDNLTLLRTDPKSPEWNLVKPFSSYWDHRDVAVLSEDPESRLRIDWLSQCRSL